MRDIIITILFYFSIHPIITGTTVTIYKVQHCAGKYLDIKCPLNHLIYIDESIAHYRHPQDQRTDCRFTNTTCQENFIQQIYHYCAKRNLCVKQIGLETERTMLCRGGVHEANHIEISYRCISVAAITDVCSISRVSFGEGFIASPRFPSSIPARRSQCHCTIRSESVFYMQLIEAKLQAIDNKCVEQLSFGEKRFCPNTSTGYYPNEQLMINKESSISFIRKIDGGAESGKFWLKYKAYAPEGEVTIDCNHNKTSTDIIGDLIPEKHGSACKQRNLTIICNSNELIYIHEAEKAYINSTASIRQCPSGRSLCKTGYDQPALTLCGSKPRCQIQIGNNRSIECDNRKYPENVINIQYKCAPASKLVNVCNKMSMTLLEGFITSPGYPMAMHGDNLDCMCTVDTGDSVSSVVQMRLIEAYLIGTGGRCMEELTVGDTTYCPTNSKTSYYFHDKQHSSPVRVHLKANGSLLNEHGKFWIRFYGYGQPLKVMCGPTPSSFYTKPVQSTTLGTTFHQESSTASEILISSSSTLPSTKTSTVTTTIRPSSKTQTASSTVHTQSHGDGGILMTTLTYRPTNTVKLTHQNTVSESVQTEKTTTVDLIKSSTQNIVSSTVSLSTSIPRRTRYTTKIIKTTFRNIYHQESIATFHSKDIITVGTPGYSSSKEPEFRGTTTSSAVTHTRSTDVTSTRPGHNPPTQIVEESEPSQMALVGGLIGAAAALVMITVGLIIILMYLIKKKRRQYHMKPEKQSELPDKYTYT